MFSYGRLNGVVRITFNTGKVSFATFVYGNRRGWLRGAALRELEDAWAEETKELRVEDLKKKRAIELLEKLNMFGMSGITEKEKQRKEIAALLEEERKGARALKDAKKAPGSTAGAGIMQAFMDGGENRV